MTETGSSSESTDRVSMLTFELQSDGYCVESDRVSSVLGVGDTGVVDAAEDPWNAGEIDVGGERIRVVDLARVFTAPTASIDRSSDPMLLVFGVTDDAGAYYGWLVDDVGITRRVDRDRIEPNPQSGAFVAGHLPLEGETYRWLDERAIHD
ncbi:chemotaxis protein CheW [Natronosalvus halobius]|uniref:chemotaxis protein CheW n=1 Tax=Natronosalvus halobius TaxID=2953746 RepID=UPI00209F2784|nr:chemotaxis protein CheW [Natronosalvus halobius]USZ70467.1 chemotaxis protein CheW [Natronosalvus halobius]